MSTAAVQRSNRIEIPNGASANFRIATEIVVKKQGISGFRQVTLLAKDLRILSLLAKLDERQLKTLVEQIIASPDENPEIASTLGPLKAVIEKKEYALHPTTITLTIA